MGEPNREPLITPEIRAEGLAWLRSLLNTRGLAIIEEPATASSDVELKLLEDEPPQPE